MMPLTVDVARSSGTQQLEDFAGESLIQMRSPGRVAEQEGRVLFEDLAAPLSYRLQVSVDQESFAFTRPEASNMVVSPLSHCEHGYECAGTGACGAVFRLGHRSQFANGYCDIRRA
jgi:hypothetical protein